MSHAHHHGVVSDLIPLHRELRQAIPDVYAGFGALHKAAFAPGVLSVAFKELVALALAVAEGCGDCIAVHAKEVARHGASPAEVAEVLGVTFLMNGGPGRSHAAHAYDAYLEFAADTTAVTA